MTVSSDTGIDLEATTLCLALIRPGSALATLAGLSRPSFAIYEHSEVFGTRELRWGDGSGLPITQGQLSDLVLLPQFGKARIAELFDY